MPEIIPLGWFHTAMGILALLSGFYSLSRYHFLRWAQTSSKIYLIATILTASTALAIFQRDGFNIAHGLAVLTLLALLAGGVLEIKSILGRFSKYFQALCYTATLLFHMIPAITDGLMRLPVGDPIVTSIKDPLLGRFYLAFLIVFVVFVGFQFKWLKSKAS